MKPQRTVFALPFLLAALVLGTIQASTTAASIGDRPFKAIAEGSSSQVAPGVFVFEEYGNATHLGSYRGEGVFIATGVNPDGTVSLIDFATHYAPGSGEAFYSSGAAVADLGTGVVWGTDTILGGTGRFEEATGTIAFVAVPTSPTTYRSTIEGSIDY